MLRVHNQGMDMERVIATFLHVNTGLKVPHIIARPTRPPNTWEQVIVFYVKDDIMHTLKRVWDHFGDPDMSRSISRLMRAGMHWIEQEHRVPLGETDLEVQNFSLQKELKELQRAYAYEKKRADLASAGWKRMNKAFNGVVSILTFEKKLTRDGASAKDTNANDVNVNHPLVKQEDD